MIAPKPPYSVVRDLAAYDKDLRLRWSTRRDLWMVEKKLEMRHPSVEKERPNLIGKSAVSQDLFDAARDGYVHILDIHPSLLRSEIILGALRSTDLNFHGSWAAINRRLDEIQAAEDAALDRQLDTFVEAGSREIYDRDQVLGGRKIYVPNKDVPAPPVITPVVQGDGFVIRDRRVTA
jgi:hypothetical protein